MRNLRLMASRLSAALMLAGCGGGDGPSEPNPTTGTISGRVTDASTASPLDGVSVTTQPATGTVQSDAQGNYSIADVAAGAYTVTAAKAGYNNGNANATVTAGQTVTANLTLAPIPNFNGAWSGTTSQDSTISFTIQDNAFTIFSIGFTVSGASCSGEGMVTIPYTTPNPISGNAFTISQTGAPPLAISLTASGTFTSNTTANGTADFTVVQSPPLPSCTATGTATWTATRP